MALRALGQSFPVMAGLSRIEPMVLNRRTHAGAVAGPSALPVPVAGGSA